MKRVIALALGAILILSAQQAIDPPDASAACPGGCITIREHNAITSGGATRTFCTGSFVSPSLAVSDLNAWYSSGCTGNDWNDCVSSVIVSGLPSCWRIYMWTDRNYTGSADTFWNTGSGVRVNMHSGFNDTTSSIKLYKVC